MKKFRMTIAALAGCSMLAGVLPQAWSDSGDIIVQRQVSPRTAFRPGTGPVTSKINATDGVTSGLGLNQHHGGTVGYELTNQQFANVVSGIPQGGPSMAQAGTFAGSSIASYGVTAGMAVTGALSGNSVGGAGGGGGTAGAVTGATGQIVNALQGMGLMGR